MIGQLRHLIDILNLVSVDDGQGGQAEEWLAADTQWASIRDATGDEIFAAGQGQNVITTIVRMRHSSELTHASKIRHGAREFEVVAINDIDERGRWHEVKCKEAQP